MSDLVFQLLAQFGLPTTMLIGLAWYHVKVIKSKDAEISRLNDARVNEKEEATDRLLGMLQEFNQLQEQQTQTLTLLAERIPQPGTFRR